MESKKTCKSCNHEKNTKNGICIVRKGNDGLPVMCVCNWAKSKHYYIENYLDLFVRAISRKWGGNINYLDLFCGPGKCLLRKTGEEVDGSPLINPIKSLALDNGVSKGCGWFSICINNSIH